MLKKDSFRLVIVMKNPSANYLSFHLQKYCNTFNCNNIISSTFVVCLVDCDLPSLTETFYFRRFDHVPR